MEEMHANPVEIIKKEIYIIKNKINNKVYIGQAKDSQQRFISHCKKTSGIHARKQSIDYAIYKYGKENFWVEILEPLTEDYNEREKYWIEFYNSRYPNGYNIQSGGNEPPVFYGENHPMTSLTQKQVDEIKTLLKNTKESLLQIAKKFNVSKKTILRINQGKTWKSNNETYPIRDNPNLSGKLSEAEVDKIIYLLKNSLLFSGEIGKMFGVNEHAINYINTGITHYRNNIDYPIRKWKSCGVRAVTYEQLLEIIELLKNSKISINKIAKMYNVNSNVIYNINSGTAKKYRIENEKYPIRSY